MLFAQAPSFEFERSYPQGQAGITALETADGDYLLVAASQNTPILFDGPSIIIYRLSPNGELMDSVYIERDGFKIGILLLEEQEGGYLMIGYLNNHLENDSSYLWATTLLDDLSIVNEHTTPIGDFPVASLGCQVISDKVVCVGSSFSAPGYFPFAFKYDIPSEEWAVYSDFLESHLLSNVIPIPNRRQYLIRGFGLMRTDANFQVQQSVSPPPYALSQIGYVVGLTDSTFLLSGRYIGTAYEFVRDIGLAICRYDGLEGVKLVSFGRPDSVDYAAHATSIDYIQRDKIYCGGTSNHPVSPSYWYTDPTWFMLAQFDSLLNQNWVRSYGRDKYYDMYGLLATQDGGCLMYGFAYDKATFSFATNLYALKVDANGEIVSNTTIPVKVGALQAYPNPCVEELHLSWPPKLERARGQQVVLYDTQGRVVLRQSVESAESSVDIRNLPAGVYEVVLRDERGQPLARTRVVVGR